MHKNKYTIIGIGEILWDIYGETKYLGGAPANFAIHCHNLGDDGFIVSRVGADSHGDEIKIALKQKKLNNQFIQTDKIKPTGSVSVTLDEAGKPSFDCTKDVAFDYLEFDPRLINLAGNADAVLFGTLAQRNKTSRQTIHQFLSQENNLLKIYDINLRGWNKDIEKIVARSLKLANVVKLNDNELNILRSNTQPQLDDRSFLNFLIQNYQLKLAALTLGENGSVIATPNDIVQMDGLKINAVDTTGCGDAFAAGLVYQYLRGKSLEDILIFSNRLGAYVAQFAGATPSYSLKDITNFEIIHNLS